MKQAPSERGEAFADALRAEIARYHLEDRLTVKYVAGEEVVRLTVFIADGVPPRILDYTPTGASVSPLVKYLRVESRLVAMHREREQYRIAAAETERHLQAERKRNSVTRSGDA